MSLPRQAKVLSKAQSDAVLAFLGRTRQADRNKLIFLLSTRAGLRAKEIACLTWEMVTGADGAISAEIALRDIAAKGSSGRVIPVSKELRAAIEIWKSVAKPTDLQSRVIT